MLKIKFKGLFGVQYSFPQNGALYEIMLKNMVKPDRPLMTL
jgi:hypothetical protein